MYRNKPFSPDYKKAISEQEPLVHCLTNHITILDCANIALALGARPIMAEHPEEAAQITEKARAAVYNLGNITDQRMEAILLSGEAALQKQLPTVLDLVGVGISKLRLNFARTCLTAFSPTILKGNASEIRAISGLESHACGIDAGAADAVNEKTLSEAVKMTAEAAKRLGTILLVTGKYDLISDGLVTYLAENGCPEMSRVTGTGCMLGVVLAAFAGAGKMSPMPPAALLEQAAYATAMFGICGEEAMAGLGPGTGKVRLFDQVHAITDETIKSKMKIRRYESGTFKEEEVI